MKLITPYAQLADPGIETVAGISGGRTSALMASMLHPSTLLCFENTGLEDQRTYEFLVRLEDALERSIVWLEWRPPPSLGDPPRMFGFDIVSRKTAHYGGELLRGMLQCLAQYRKTKEPPEGPISPWAKSRICTSYLKHRVQESYVRSLGWDTYDTYVGMRADEPSRVASLRKQETQKRGFRMPLNELGIDKPAVKQFWSAQTFDLELEEHEGNCTNCFLKDESDIARQMQRADASFWLEIEREFPEFGGRQFKGYAQLKAEYPLREHISQCLRNGTQVIRPEHLTNRRFLSIVRQERARLDGTLVRIPCSCESTIAGGDQLEFNFPSGAIKPAESFRNQPAGSRASIDGVQYGPK